MNNIRKNSSTTSCNYQLGLVSIRFNYSWSPFILSRMNWWKNIVHSRLLLLSINLLVEISWDMMRWSHELIGGKLVWHEFMECKSFNWKKFFYFQCLVSSKWRYLFYLWSNQLFDNFTSSYFFCRAVCKHSFSESGSGKAK